jgi:uncharacterized repeat protein (TIGR01451 family)
MEPLRRNGPVHAGPCPQRGRTAARHKDTDVANRVRLAGRRRPRTASLLLLLGLGVASAPALAAIVLTPTFTGPAEYTPGAATASSYTLVVANSGDTLDNGPSITTNFPAQATVSWSCASSASPSNCGGSGSGTGNLARSNDKIAPGGTVTYSFTVSFGPAMTADPLEVTATVTDSNATPLVTTDTVSSTLRLESDVSVAKTSPQATYSPGGTGTYSVVVANAGPSQVTGVALTDTAPTGMTLGAWTCAGSGGASCPAASGSGNLAVTGITLPRNGSLTYSLAASYALTATADPIVNTASITVPAAANDPDTDDHSSSSSKTRVVATDLSLAFSPASPAVNPTATYVPGSTGHAVSLLVSNAGPSNATAAPVTLVLPAEVSAASWTCSSCVPASGTGNISTAATIAAGGSATIQITLAFASDALTSPLLLPAAVAAGSGQTDPATGNNTATNGYAISRQADIAVSKTDGQTSVNPGTAFTYQITVTNKGPSDVGNGPDELGVLLDDTFVAQLQGAPGTCTPDASQPCWRYCASDGGTVGNVGVDNCPGEVLDGSGNINDLAFQLRAGSSSTLRAYVALGGTASGTISNTATVSLGDAAVTEVGPSTDNTSTDVTTVEVSTDVQVEKTDNAVSAVPGTSHSYQVTVRNAGFITVNDVAVADALPLFQGSGAGFVPGTISWQCRAFDGACCNHNSAVCGTAAPTPPVVADAMAAAVDLPGQSRVVFTVTGQLDPRASGTLSNTASATLPPGITDTNPANNSATDANTVLQPQALLTVAKTLDSLTPEDGPPFTLQYRIVVGNDGPSHVTGAQVTDALGSPLLLPASASWSCTVVADPGQTRCPVPASGSGPLSALVDLDPGGQLRFDLSVDTTDIAAGQVENTAEITSPAGNASATLQSGLAGQADLVVSKTDNKTQAAPGTETEYLITVRNKGPDDVFGARVRDSFAPELENVSWSCEATTPVPGNLEYRTQVGTAATGGHALAISADGRHAYVVGTDVNSLFVFTRDNVPGTTFGQMAALETEINGVNDPLDPGPAVTHMAGPIDVAMSHDGTMVYVLSKAPPGSGSNANALVAFNRTTNPADPGFGKLSFAGSVTTGVPTTPRRMIVTAQNIHVSGDAGVAIYRRDAVSGLPVFDQLHTASMPAMPGPLAVSAADNLLFVGSTTGNAIAAFAINMVPGATPVGRLSHVATLADAQFAGVRDLLVAGGGQLYVAAETAARLSLVQFTAEELSRTTSYARADLIAPPGQPSPPALPDPLAGPLRLALATDGEHLVGVSPTQGALLQFRRDPATGALAYEALLRGNGHAALENSTAAGFTSDGRHLLVASASTATRPLVVYSRRAPDPLFAFIEQDRQGDPLPGGGNLAGMTAPADVAVSRDGRHVYAVSLQDNRLLVFERFNTRGLSDDTLGEHLQFMVAYDQGQGGVAGLLRPSNVLVSPDGGSVFVSSEEGNSLAVFARDNDPGSANFGRLTWRQALHDNAGGNDGLLGARGMAMDNDSRHLYVAGSFESAIGIYRRNPDRTLSFVAVARSGTDGVTGLAGIRELVVTRDGLQLIGVSAIADTVVVFDRNANPASGGFGRLSFVQARGLASGDRPVALALPASNTASENEHVYVVAENSSRLYVLRRVLDPGSPASGSLVPLFAYANNAGGITRMAGPRDVKVSPDGKRVYVAAQFGHSVLVFDRDGTRSSSGFGSLALVETRSDGVDGVDGLNNVYAITVSNDSRNVYAAGFGDNAIASFAIGTGSTCSAGGGGDIDDLVDIGVGGTIVYRASARIRPSATGVLQNLAEVELPARFTDPNPADNAAIDTTMLVGQADISVTKTNDRVSVVAGEIVSYDIVVRNSGPSNIVHGPGSVLTITDLLDSNPGFVPGTASWSCVAAGSGALDFVQGYPGGVAGVGGLQGVSGLALVPDADGAGPLGSYLASASVLDSTLGIFRRDPVDGRLTPLFSIAHGSQLGGMPVTALSGARAVVASSDGRFLYVASRVSDSVTVFRLANDGAGQLQVSQHQVVQGLVGLDQALHLALSPSGTHLYVAGANDAAIAVFARDAATGLLAWIESEQNGVDDPDDAGGTVAGLENVEFVAVSPDGAHLYALSGSSGSVSIFARNPATGRLSWRSVVTGNSLGLSMAGASSAVFDASGEYLYVTAADANRVLVLRRNVDAGAGTFGALTLASSVTQDVAGSQGLLTPRRAALSADGLHLYVTAQSGGSVAWFIRDPADGSLRFLGLRSNESAGVDGLAGASGIVVDDALAQVYVAGALQATVTQFERQVDSLCPPSGSGDLDAIPLSIAAGGSVTFRLSVQVASGQSGTVVNTVTIDSPQDPNQANNQATDTDVVAVVADLTISKTDGIAEYDGLAGASAIAGDEQHLYVAGAGDNAIGVYRRHHDPGQSDHGSVAFASVVRGGQDGVTGLAAVSDLLLGVGGDHLYAISPTENSIATFRRARDTGRLTFLAIAQNGVLGVSGLSGPQALAQSPDGRHVYVAGGFSNAVATFSRDADPTSPGYGRLSFRGIVQNGVSGVDGIESPVALQVSPDGRHVYVLGAGQNTIAVFMRNPNPGSSGFGDLSFVARHANNQAGFSGLAGVRSLLVSDNGAHVYVLGATAGTLVRLARNIDSGLLAPAQVLADGSGGFSGLAGARRLRFSPAREHIYVAAATADAVLRFDLDGDGVAAFGAAIRNGDPAPSTGGQVIGLRDVRDLRVSPDGGQLYGVAAGDGALTVFARTPGEDALDFRAVLFDGLGGVAPGEQVTYSIVARNLGPSNVPNAVVTDTFPDAFSSVSWTCTASGGAQCLFSGNGNIATPVNLPVGGQVVILATGVVGESASGRLSNTATISAVGSIDPDPSNNSATDNDTVLTPAMDLVVEVDDGDTVSVPGGTIDYTVTVSNLGPTYAAGASVEDAIPPALHDVAWSCQATPVAGALALTQQLAAPTDAHTAFAVGALGNFVYVTATRAGVGVVLVYQRNPLSGALTELHEYRNGVGGVAGIDGAAHLLLSSDQRFVYVAGAASDAIAVFARNTGSGLLTFVRQYQDGELGIDGLGGVRRLLLSPSGAHLYAAGSIDDAIAVFAVNASSGLLTQVGLIRQSMPGVDGLNGVVDLAWSADAGHLLAVAEDNQSLAAFARTPATGALAFAAIVHNFELGSDALLGPAALAVHQDQVFVAAAGSGRVGRFRFTGGATPGFVADLVIANGSGGVSGLAAPQALRYEPDQARLYVADGSAVHLFSLLGEAAEPLARYDASTVPVLEGVAALALSHNGRQLYAGAASNDGGIAVFARERGSRCPIAGSDRLGRHAVDIAPGGSVVYAVGGSIFANAQGSLAYLVRVDPPLPEQELNPVDNSATDVNLLSPAPDLSIAKTDDRDEVVAGLPTAYRITLGNAGVSDALAARVVDLPPLFPVDTAGVRAGIGEWACSSNLPLAFAAATGPDVDAALQGVTVMALAPDGSRLYAVNPSLGALLVFPRSPDGALGTPQLIVDGSELAGTVVQGMAGASSVALSADGRHVVVTATAAHGLVVFAVDGDGSHRFVQKRTSGSDGVSGLQGPVDVVISADGRRVFVAAAQSDAIVVFSRDAGSGALTFVERVRDGLGTIVPDSNVIRGVRRLQLSRDGSELYAVAPLSHALSRFGVNPASGQLSYLGARRHTEAGLAGLAGARDLVASPGDRQLYVLGNATVTLFDLEAGAPVLRTAYAAIPGLGEARALQLDAHGSRLYLADGAGGVHVFARDWNDGTLDHRFRLQHPDPTLAAPVELLHAAVGRDLYAATPAAGIARLDELALSRCLVGSGSEDRIETDIDLGAGGWAEFDFALEVHPSARGVLTNLATVQPADGSDPQPADNLASDATTIRVVSDLSITKTGPAQTVAGLPIAYRIEIGNAGPSDALGVQLIDTLHPALIEASWSCSGAPGCPAGGAGSLAPTFDVMVGDTLVFDIQARVASHFVGNLPNTATLVAEAGASDPTPDDHAATVVTEVIAVADVSAAKSNGVDGVVAGTAVDYLIEVANAGPSDAPQVRVVDLLPTTLTAATWTCTAFGGAACPPAGTGSIDLLAALPAGARIELLVQSVLSPSALGTLSNSVQAQVLGDVLDPQPDNNSATDTDAIAVVPDLMLQLVDPLDPFDPGGSIALPYQAIVANAGPSYAHEVRLVLDAGVALTQIRPGVPCLPAAGTAIECDLGTLAAGGTIVLQLAFGNLPPAPGELVMQGTVTTVNDDPDLANNMAVQTTQLVTGGDISVSVDNQRDRLELGQAVTYRYVVTNIGSQAVSGLTVQALVAPELDVVGWNCAASAGVTCTAPSGRNLADTLTLARGQVATYLLDATVRADLDPLTTSLVVQTISAGTAAGADINPANNVATDADPVLFSIFRDGFEALLPRLGSAELEVLARFGECVAVQVQDASVPTAALLQALRRAARHLAAANDAADEASCGAATGSGADR